MECSVTATRLLAYEFTLYWLDSIINLLAWRNIRPLQINFLFPIQVEANSVCGRAVVDWNKWAGGSRLEQVGGRQWTGTNYWPQKSIKIMLRDIYSDKISAYAWNSNSSALAQLFLLITALTVHGSTKIRWIHIMVAGCHTALGLSTAHAV